MDGDRQNVFGTFLDFHGIGDFGVDVLFIKGGVRHVGCGGDKDGEYGQQWGLLGPST